MIEGEAFKSAAEVWYKEGEASGRIAGRIGGLLHGQLIGQIQHLQQWLKRPVAADEQLEQLPVEDLQTLVEDLQRQKLEQH
jgi:predicted transposase YdaD